jgi:hypothetical protein
MAFNRGLSRAEPTSLVLAQCALGGHEELFIDNLLAYSSSKEYVVLHT